MRFGTYFFLQATPDRTPAEILTEELDQMVLSERLGFDSVWLTEHHFSDYGLSAAPSVLAAALAARTSRISIGTAVYVIPFHNPIRLAEETATLDILSGGRIVVGIGRGNRPLEFVGHGIVQDESRTRMEEGVDILVEAWTKDQVTFHGRHWDLERIPVQPQPLQKPHPPIAIAASSDQSVAWAAQHGWRILSSGLEGRPKSMQTSRSRPSRPVNRTKFGRRNAQLLSFRPNFLGRDCLRSSGCAECTRRRCALLNYRVKRLTTYCAGGW